MIRVFYRVLFVLFLVAGALRGVAQNNEVAAWLVDSELSESTIVDDGDSAVFDFNEEVGYAISFNRFWTRSLSTEIALQRYDAEMSVTPEGLATFVVGELRVTSITLLALWHFNRDGIVSPYAGGGIARIGGEFEFVDDVEDPAPEMVSLRPENTWTIAGGASVRLTRQLALTGEVKYVPWDAREKHEPQLEDAVEVDPMTFAAGVRWRF